MTLQGLLDEYETVGIGERIWSLLVEVTARTCSRYPPEIYADGSQWNSDSIEDLAQSVALERLLGESQLEYIFTIAGPSPSDGVDVVSRLLAVQVKRTLAHRRSPSVVDRIIRRMKKLLDSPIADLRVRVLGAESWLYGSSEREPGALTPGDRHRGVHRLSDIPRIPTNPRGERESKVFTSDQLVLILHRLTDEYEGIYLSDVRRILEDSLTAWLPAILHDTEIEHSLTSQTPTETEVDEMAEEMRTFLQSLSRAHVAVMIGKSNGVSDTSLAAQLQCSRPTIIKYKGEYMLALERLLLEEIPADLHSLAVEVLLEQATEKQGADHR